MLDTWIELSLFTAKAIIIVVLVLCLVAGLLAILSRGRIQSKGKLSIKNINEEFNETKKLLLGEILPKKEFKLFLKETKTEQKKKQSHKKQKNLFVLDFNGDIKASAVAELREEITAILSIAKPHDEVMLRLESPGGMVNAYGLAAAQLLRIREKHIPLTIAIDKMAASGGYMMACVANKILAAPFAIIGSIGVIVQLPNFHRYLKDKHIDFEQHMAGDFKRTITLFGENTEEGRQKLRQEMEEIHHSFKDLIIRQRPQIDIQKVATGEHWLGQQALDRKLIDALQTSDAYLLEQSQQATLFEISYTTKKSLLNRLTGAATHKTIGEHFRFAKTTI